MKRKLIFNTATNYVVFVLQIIIAFVMTPLYVKYMGLRDYGLWEVVVSIIGYAGMLDLGLWPTISRFVAKYTAEQNSRKQEETFATALVFLSMLGIAGALLTVGLVVAIEHQLFLGGGDEATYYRMFLAILMLNVILKFPSIVVEAYLEGQQRYYAKNLITIISMLISTTVIYSLIDQTRGLLLLAVVSVVGLAAKVIVYYVLVFRNPAQSFQFKFSAFSLSHLRVLLTFGIKSFVQGVATRATNQSSPIIIASLGTSALVPLYTIPASLVRYSTNLLMTSTHVFMPLFSELSAQGQSHRIRHIFMASNKLVIGAGILLLIGISTVGPSFVRVWISDEVAQGAAPILFWLAFGGLGLALNPFGSRYLTAMDRHGVYAKYAPPFAVLSIVAGTALYTILGLPGLAFGFAIPTVISIPIFVRPVCDGLEISMRYYVHKSIVPSVLPAVMTVATWLAWVHYRGHPASYAAIASLAIMMSLVFVVAFLALDYFRPKGERTMDLLRV